MENNYPKDPIEEGKSPLDLENDNFIYPENDYDDYAGIFPDDDFPDDDLDPYDEVDYGDIFDDLEGLDESDLY